MNILFVLDAFCLRVLNQLVFKLRRHLLELLSTCLPRIKNLIMRTIVLDKQVEYFETIQRNLIVVLILNEGYEQRPKQDLNDS